MDYVVSPAPCGDITFTDSCSLAAIAIDLTVATPDSLTIVVDPTDTSLAPWVSSTHTCDITLTATDASNVVTATRTETVNVEVNPCQVTSYTADPTSFPA